MASPIEPLPDLGPRLVPRGRLLLVEDDPLLLPVYARILRRAGYEVVELGTGDEVPAVVEREPFDLVLTDVGLPGTSGIELLRAIRAQAPDLPVVLMTGGNDVADAARAVELGALRYLLKPIAPATLVQAADDAMSAARLAHERHEALRLYATHTREEAARDALGTRFDQALRRVHLVYQPIVRWSTGAVHAYEALVRSDTPGLAQPADLFAAAEQLGRVHELGRAIRALAARMAQQVARLFVNLHPLDLEDADLFRPDAPLSRFGPRVVLEITERAPLDGLVGLAERNAELRALGFRVALDDLGAGYSGLATFVNLKPDVVKLDMALTRHIDSEPRQRMLVETLVALCRELGIDVIAEGVETEAERDVLVTAGCDLLQGFLFGRPQRTLID